MGLREKTCNFYVCILSRYLHVYLLFLYRTPASQVKALAHHRESELNYLTNELESLQYAFEASGALSLISTVIQTNGPNHYTICHHSILTQRNTTKHKCLTVQCEFFCLCVLIANMYIHATYPCSLIPSVIALSHRRQVSQEAHQRPRDATRHGQHQDCRDGGQQAQL